MRAGRKVLEPMRKTWGTVESGEGGFGGDVVRGSGEENGKGAL